MSGLFSSIFDFVFVFLRVCDPRSFPPPLPREEEARLFCELRESGSVEVRNKLIEHNLRLVSHIIKKYYPDHRDGEDLVSVGTIGLIKAIDSFKTENGARFATYAAKCIRNEILMYFRSRKKLGYEVSINEAVDTDKDGNPLTYMDIISTEDTIAEDLDGKIAKMRALRAVATTLGEREREIIVLRYGLDGKRAKTQREVAVKLGISRSYVSRIEKAALEKIKESLMTPGIN